MQVRWKKLFLKTSVWLTAEIILTVVGLDNLADYSEFVLQNQTITQVTEAFSNLITLIS
ncbi:MAG: hypothetical protein QNJ49_10525 [Mastigocoleus sp. MO_167.B18]|uniref:hypothetical protein n=1 Tax=Mastigocoleus sp. MO_188.B34 TaxID=3036635 RepID=UPI00261212D0|nr:hypothetical protein [Mastigocoleus sp. MO_188.B34]MDJ0698000.1 hypothetical protein [Mastigocoleus sp. MO_188.B34]MDJ0773843.1 hypothetical protein [Mastigocoleus sp. MO_167.B18]